MLLDHPTRGPISGRTTPGRLTHTRTAADPETDLLQVRLAALMEQSAAAGEPIAAAFFNVRGAALEAATGGRGRPAPGAIPSGLVEGRPRLTEPWFC